MPKANDIKSKSSSDATVNQTPIVAVLTAGIVLSLACGAAAAHIETIYLSTHSFFFDPISYSMTNAKLYIRLAHENQFVLAWQEFLTNDRNPLRTIPLLIFCPQLLAERSGHMITALPALITFVTLLGWTTYKRSQHLAYCLATMMLFCALPGMFNPLSGLGSYWLDLVSAFWLGAATLCLMNSQGGRSLMWLATFSLMVSIATLNRYVAAGYALFACGPVLITYLTRRAFSESNLLHSTVIPCAVVLSVGLATSGYFIFAHMASVAHYYNTFGYALHSPVAIAFRDDLPAIIEFFSGILLILLLGNFVALALIADKSKRAFWTGLAESLWYALSMPLFLIVVLRAAEGSPHTYYAVPLFYIACVVPLNTIKKREFKRELSRYACVLALTGAISAVASASSFLYIAACPSWQEKLMKRFDQIVADTIDKLPTPILWDTFFDERACITSMELFYKSKKLVLPANCFTIHESYWLGNYGRLNPHKLAAEIYDKAVQHLTFAIAFADPQQAMSSILDNNYSRTVAFQLAACLKSDPRWKAVLELTGTPYGKLVGYVNLSLQPQLTEIQIAKFQLVKMLPATETQLLRLFHHFSWILPKQPDLYSLVGKSRVSLGSGWYGPERYKEDTYCWANNDAELWIPPSHTQELDLELEPGPGLGSKPCLLQLLNERGKHLAEALVTGRQTIRFIPPRSFEGDLIKLHVESSNCHIPNDPRIMNFRLFKITLLTE